MTAGLDVEDRLLLRQSAADALDRHAAMSRIRALTEAGEDIDAQLETQLRQLGWYDMEATGDPAEGEANFADVAMIVQQLGAHCAISPYLAVAAVAAGGLLAAPGSEAKTSWVSRISSEGTYLGACLEPLGLSRQGDRSTLHGTASGVLNARHCGGLLVVAGEGPDQLLAVVGLPHDGIALRPLRMYDATRAVDDVEFRDVAVDGRDVLASGAAAAVIVERMMARAAVAVTADSLGLAGRALELTVDYTRARHQFGRPIGSFQAVKHQLADRYIELTAAQSLLDAAAREVADGAPNAARSASAAKAVGCESATRAIGTAIQLHGAIGYTWEYDLHLLMKRAVLNEMLMGTVRWHRDQVGAAVAQRQSR